VLNNTNCNLHDLALQCTGLSIDQCKTRCEADPGCAGFLYTPKTGSFQLKNASCWVDVGPLPPADYGDELYVMRPSPQPAPLPAVGVPLSSVEICVSDPSEHLGSATDEGYTLTVPVDGVATVSARSIFGAMHGLESLTQLLDVRVGSGAVTSIPSCPVNITDAPRFEYRGLLIDSGRYVGWVLGWLVGWLAG
jgi:hexosaminidase